MIGCSDIDECVTETDESDDDATYANNVGNYTCAFYLSFEVSGRTCEDIK